MLARDGRLQSSSCGFHRTSGGMFLAGWDARRGKSQVRLRGLRFEKKGHARVASRESANPCLVDRSERVWRSCGGS